MTAKTNQYAWIVKVTMLLYQEIAQNGKLRKTSWPSNTQRKFHSQMLANAWCLQPAFRCLQPSFDPSKNSYATVTQTPPQSSRPLPPWAKKIWLPIDFRTEIEYLKYILNYCLTGLDTLDEITPENPVPRDAPSSDEAPPPPQTTPEQKNESTIPNAESTMQSAASKMNPQSRMLSLLCNLQLQMMSTTMRMK